MNRALNFQESREFGQPMGLVPRKALIAAVLAAAIIGLVIGVLLGHYAIGPEYGLRHKAILTPLVNDADTTISQLLLSQIHGQSISSYLKNLTSQPHLAGTTQDLAQAKWLESHFKASGFDEVKVVPYDVLLSYPHKENQNQIFILSPEGNVVYTINSTQPPLDSDERKFDLQTFNAYSKNGTVPAKLIYVNYGREDDFQYLRDKNIPVKGNIVLARLGKIFRANIVKFAEEAGAVGVILFLDPKDYGPPKNQEMYPHTIYLPPFGAQSGTVKISEGDPLTPHFPAITTAYRIPEENAILPKIPVQPIGYQDAQALLQTLSGSTQSPDDWHGGLNVTYELGPSPQQTVRMEIHTFNERKTTYNVIAVMRGRVEPDRYVLLGNHRDAWTFGAVDPSSGTAALMELGRVFGELKKDNEWTPRRSLVFCSWGAEEYGLVGSVEWTEDLQKLLGARAVAYINVDEAVVGNVTLSSKAVPLLYTALFEAAKKVENPNKTEVAEGKKTVYDSWYSHRADKHGKERPEVEDIGSGSDYVGFIHNLGIPSVDMRYMDPKFNSSYPLYHTLYDTYHFVADLLDVGFHRHVALTKVWGELARSLADSLILPFDVVEYAVYLNQSIQAINEGLGPKFKKRGVKLDDFEKAVDEFCKAAQEFHNVTLHDVDRNNPLAVRSINDQMMLLERSFLNPLGLPMGRHDINHVVFAPSSADAYSGVSFAGLWDLLHKIDNASDVDKRWEEVKKHLAEITFYVKRAATVLKGDLNAL